MIRIVCVAPILISCAFGQSFEVASIRPHVSNAAGGVARVSMTISGARFTAEDVGLTALIGFAYADEFKNLRITGEPGWAGSARFDVNAKAEGDGPLSAQLGRKMLQTLLADRFQLKHHVESKEVPGYSLVVAKNGPALKPSTPDSRGGMRMNSTGPTILMTASKWSLERLAGQLSGQTSKPVLDRTGLAGEFDFQLTFVHDGASDTSAPELLTALQEQLGLKLEPTRVAMEVLVIDHAEKPSEN